MFHRSLIFSLLPLAVLALVTNETLLPVGGDTTTINPTLQYNVSTFSYTWSFSVGSDSYSYIVPLNSIELQTGRLRVLCSVNGDTFTPIAGAAPDYYLSGNINYYALLIYRRKLLWVSSSDNSTI